MVASTEIAPNLMMPRRDRALVRHRFAVQVLMAAWVDF